MGKKSRRQKQPEPHELGERWDAIAILRYKDGRPISDDDFQQLRETKRAARDVVDTQCRYPPGKDNITHDWLDEYQFAVAYPRIRTKGMDSALKALVRWPRLQKYWPRLRRRVCDHCHAQVALSEPRHLVCGGCGVARYCCEACQRADWEWHQIYCADMARRRRVDAWEKFYGLRAGGHY